MANEVRKEKFVIIGGPSRKELLDIFCIQHMDNLLDSKPPFITFKTKKAYNNGFHELAKDILIEIELAFYPSKIEYLDDTGQKLGVAGYISCFSTRIGGHKSPFPTKLHVDGHYDTKEKIGAFMTDRNSYRESEFKKQFSKELEVKIQQAKSLQHTKTTDTLD